MTDTRGKKPLRAALAAGALCLLATAAAPAEEGLRIGLLPIDDALPFLALEEEKSVAGLETVMFRSALERDSALEAGGVDAVIMDPLTAAIMRSRGREVAIVTVLLGASPREGRFALLAAPGSGITSPVQLRGVPVAGSSSTVIEYVTETLLAEAGLGPGEIVREEVRQIQVRYQMLMAGQVKAAVLGDPLAYLAESQGARLLADDTRGRNLSQMVLVFSRGALEEKKAAARSLLARYATLVSRINADPERYRPLLAARGGMPAAISAIYPVPAFPPPQLPDRESIGFLLSWAKGKGLLARPVTWEEMMDGGFLP